MNEFYNIYAGGLLQNLFVGMVEFEKKRKKEQAGITVVNGFEGIPHLNIPHKYYAIDINADGYFYCRNVESVEVYSKEGKFLFDCHKLSYKKYGMFLAGKRKEVIIVGKQNPDDFGYALYDNDRKLTEPIFRPMGMSECFNEFGFAIVGLQGKYNYAIINREGKILLETGSFDSPYLYGVVCTDTKNYINLLTGEIICDKGYDSLYTDDFLFIRTESNCVYQINKNTGAFTVHGEVKKKPAPAEAVKEPIGKTLEATKPIIKKQGRNELCNCGSGKKYKNCCIHKTEP